jgi:hypothetical protein
MNKSLYYFSKELLTIYLLSFYVIFYSLYEFPYIYDLYYCGRINLCMSSELVLTLNQILILHLLKITSAFGLFVSRFRITSLCMLWFVNVVFMFANRYLHSPEQAFINFLLLILIIFFVEKRNKKGSQIDVNNKYKSVDYTKIYAIVFYAAYTYSGFTKFNSEAWLNGSFMHSFFTHNHLVISNVSFNWVPIWCFHALTYFTVFIEMFSFLGLANRYLGIFFWTGLTLMQLGLLLTADLKQVNLGMLICHFFVMDKVIFLWLKGHILGLASPKSLNKYRINLD